MMSERLRLVLLLAAATQSAGLLPLHLVGSRRARAPSPRAEMAPAPASASDPPPGMDDALYGSNALEQERVSVMYSGSAASRERRVRRTRRPPKEERWATSVEPEGYGRFSAFCNFDSISLDDSIQLLTRDPKFAAFGDRLSVTSYTDVVHCRWLSTFDSAGSPGAPPGPPLIRDAFLFPYGSVILWGFTAQQELGLLSLISPSCEPLGLASGDGGAQSLSPFSSTVPSTSAADDELADSEFMLFEVIDDASTAAAAASRASSASTSAAAASTAPGVEIYNNVIRLQGAGADDALFPKLAVSFAFAQSAKLAVFEAALEATSEEIRPIPVQLARRGRSKFSVKEVARLTGRVFLERNAVNLYSNILDTPDFFWEAEQYEPLYRRVNRYLDIEDRVRILNKRLDIVNDLLDSLSSQLEIRNSHRLEVIIIALITLEIALELLKEFALPPFLAPLGGLLPRRLLALLSRG